VQKFSSASTPMVVLANFCKLNCFFVNLFRLFPLRVSVITV